MARQETLETQGLELVSFIEEHFDRVNQQAYYQMRDLIAGLLYRIARREGWLKSALSPALFQTQGHFEDDKPDTDALATKQLGMRVIAFVEEHFDRVNQEQYFELTDLTLHFVLAIARKEGWDKTLVKKSEFFTIQGVDEA